MITKHDLDEAIAECQGQKNPNANTCLKLAAFYTIKKELFGGENGTDTKMYSYAPPQETGKTIGEYSGSEFLEAVRGKQLDSVMHIMNELMETMQVLQPRIFDSVMRKIQNL